MLSIGTIFIVGAGYWILGHGSAFGLANYCKGIRREHAELLAKSERGEQLNSSERQLIHYIRLSKHLDKASYVLLVAGIVLCLGGIIV
jgi:hypothetical protein